MFNHQLTQALALERQHELLRQAEHDRQVRQVRKTGRAERGQKTWGAPWPRRSRARSAQSGSLGDVGAPSAEVASLSPPTAAAAWHPDRRAA